MEGSQFSGKHMKITDMVDSGKESTRWKVCPKGVYQLDSQATARASVLHTDKPPIDQIMTQCTLFTALEFTTAYLDVVARHLDAGPEPPVAPQSLDNAGAVEWSFDGGSSGP